MSDDDYDWPDDGDLVEMPGLETEEGRDAWINALVSSDGDDDGEWSKAIVCQIENDMVMRIRYPNGDEEVFDLIVRRSMQVVRKAEAGSEN